MEFVDTVSKSSSPVATGRIPERLHVAVISAGRDVTAIFADRTADGLLTRVSEWVGGRAHRMLWPPAAERVANLLDSGERAAAVKLYFEQTGQRWDPEQLHREVLELD